MRIMLALAALTAVMFTVQANEPSSFGTLIGCDDARCLWADRDGAGVDSHEMVTQFLQDEAMDEGPNEFRQRMENHVEYLEQVHKHAANHDLQFPYAMGVNSRHLYREGKRTLSPLEFVQQEHSASQRQLERKLARVNEPRRLANSTFEYPATLDWCSTDNPRNGSICTTVKSQNQCGSCWAFAAADAIETAVVVNSGTVPQSLSPQQFLECSSREMISTFNYCWAEGGANGSSWLQTTMIWGSRNNACNGGMTHAAFADASELHWSLLSELDLPYNEEETSQSSSTVLADVCDNSTTEHASASISGWKQVVGPSCENSTSSTELLKLALQQQPISVALNSNGAFEEYKSGIYSCPNDGNFASSSDIDHAVLLVGYGSDGTTDYWIIKNSYGASWGEKGFVRLAIDEKINCGVSVFPVIPTGAISGASRSVVDGGGEVEFVGFSPDGWVTLGIVGSVATVIVTIGGVIYASRHRNAFKETL